MSSIGWIDFSSEHREKVRTVMDLLSTPGVVDELGIGVIRDAFADEMFPGISTIQTRAKYFTVTALLIRRYQTEELKKRQPRAFETYLAEEELRCRITLVERDPEALGVIGGSFGSRTDKDVIRRASSVYWAGLRLFGIVSPDDLSLAEFSRRISGGREAFAALFNGTKEEAGDDVDAEHRSGLPRVEVPEIAGDYWKELSIGLTREEAEFLRDRICHRQPRSVLAHLLGNGRRMEALADLDSFEVFAESDLAKQIPDAALRNAVGHARDFWRIMEGAHIRYNWQLRDRFGDDGGRELMQNHWQTWLSEMSGLPASWSTDFMWALVKKHNRSASGSTQIFIKSWIAQVASGCRDLALCDEVVRSQECAIKRNRARLREGNKQSVNDWIGLETIDYRFIQVRQIIRDIRDGLRTKGAVDA
jgi:hypothetical protein